MTASVAAILFVEVMKLIGLVALFVGVVLVGIYTAFEPVGGSDPRRTSTRNAVLASLCFYYAMSPSTQPIARPQSAMAPIFVWLLVAAWLAIAVAYLRPFRSATEPDVGPTLQPSSLGIVTMALLAVMEEIIFRGWLQNIALAASTALNENAYALFAVNFLFAVMHYSRGMIFALSAGFVGMVFSIATLASGSLLPAIVMHVGWNVMVGIARARTGATAEAAA